MWTLVVCITVYAWTRMYACEHVYIILRARNRHGRSNGGKQAIHYIRNEVLHHQSSSARNSRCATGVCMLYVTVCACVYVFVRMCTCTCVFVCVVHNLTVWGRAWAIPTDWGGTVNQKKERYDRWEQMVMQHTRWHEHLNRDGSCETGKNGNRRSECSVVHEPVFVDIRTFHLSIASRPQIDVQCSSITARGGYSKQSLERPSLVQ